MSRFTVTGTKLMVRWTFLLKNRETVTSSWRDVNILLFSGPTPEQSARSSEKNTFRTRTRENHIEFDTDHGTTIVFRDAVAAASIEFQDVNVVDAR